MDSMLGLRPISEGSRGPLPFLCNIFHSDIPVVEDRLGEPHVVSQFDISGKVMLKKLVASYKDSWDVLFNNNIEFLRSQFQHEMSCGRREFQMYVIACQPSDHLLYLLHTS